MTESKYTPSQVRELGQQVVELEYPSDRYEHNIKVIRFYCTYLFQNNRSGQNRPFGKALPYITPSH